MRRALCDSLPSKPGSLVPLNEDEGKHLTSVLRMSPGSEIELLDGHGSQGTGDARDSR